MTASKIYRDEPILRTAAAASASTPARYRELRKLARSFNLYGQSEAQVFYEQAKFMEDFEDDCACQEEFTRYFPTYQAMNDRQLRGYFTWRTRVRRGDIVKTSLSFAFVYVYELLHQIGVKSPEEGYHTLKNFWTAYREFDAGLDRYVGLWLRDYVVYHDLDPALLDGFSDVRFDRAILTLQQYRSHSADDIFRALKTLSPYNLDKSKFYQLHPDDVKTVVCNVFTALSEYYERNRKNSLCHKFFGKSYSSACHMFRSAVFFDRVQRRDFAYEVNAICRFRCRNGRWSCERFLCSRDKLRQTGALLKTIDCRMRRQYGFKSTLKAEQTPKLYLDLIDEEIGKLPAVRRRDAAPAIAIDLSRLQEIRATALITQSKLMVEEPEEAAAPTPTPTPAPEPSAERPAPDRASLLSETERRFLRCLLAGEPCDGLARAQGLMVSMLADSINEKLFDAFGDMVIACDGDRPAVLEDYTDELKGIIGP